jgi:hypothetical protein
MRLVIKKSDYAGKLQKMMKRRGDKPDNRIERFRKLILDCLSKQEDESEDSGVSKVMQKTLNFIEKLAKGGKGLPVGTVREWKGKKFVKVAPGKWRPKYDGESRGAKMAVSAIKRKIAAAPDAQTMLQIVLENRDRFSDKRGQPLPFVMELSKYVSERRDQVKEKDKPVQAKKTAREKYGKPEQGRAAAAQGEDDGGKAEGKDNAAKGGNGGDEPPDDGREPPDDEGGISAEKQAEIRQKLDDLAVPMEKIKYSREEYNRLFPDGTVTTPLGTVKLGDGGFDKLDAKSRQELLGAVNQTLKDPVVILGDKRGGKDAQLYIKSFREPGAAKTEHIQSVVVEIDGNNISISTGPRKQKQIEAKIKTAGSLLYLKGKEGGSLTIGTGKRSPVAQPLEPDGSASQDKVSPESAAESRDRIA